MTAVVFDAGPLLAYWRGEPGDARVASVLDAVQLGRVQGFVHEVNLAECLYILLRHAPDRAKDLVDALLGLGLEAVTSAETWQEAARLKARYPMSLADAFAVATAIRHKARLIVTEDREFDPARKEGVHLDKIRGAGSETI